jgi:hypothetical protein
MVVRKKYCCSPGSYDMWMTCGCRGDVGSCGAEVEEGRRGTHGRALQLMASLL